ncbi:MAG: DUF2892 domain-containing protein [Haloarculaceae archaeon]
MERNVGGYDRIARLVLGPLALLVAVGILSGVLDVGLDGTAGLVVTAVLLIAGAILVVTGAIRTCPANRLLGVNTYRGGR